MYLPLITPMYNKLSSKIFKKNAVEEEKDTSIGKTEEEIERLSNMGSGGYDSDLISSQISFQSIFNDKKDRISFYRNMSLYPEISDSLDHVCDDAIVDDGDGDIVRLTFVKEVPKSIQEKIEKEFKYVVWDVYKLHIRGWDLFRKWLIEAEMFIEFTVDTKKKNTLNGIKVLPAYTMYPIYDGNKIINYVQVPQSKDNSVKYNVSMDMEGIITFEPNQISYVNYGIYGRNYLDVRGFLESSIRPYNQLRNLEDSIVVYRLCRAPERRIWNIDVNKMPKGKAEEYIRKLIHKYKKRLNYNPETGAIDSTQNIQALTEDFWFPKDSEGRGSSVDTLQSGMQLGEITDVNYFLKKLYKTLKLPRTRWEENATYNAGKIGEITREEVKFTRFVERLQQRFKRFILDGLLVQLKLKGFDKKYIKLANFDVEFTQNNIFREYKEKEIRREMIDMWSSIASYVITPDNPSDGVFSREFAMKTFMGLNDDEYEENKKLVKREQKTLEQDFPNAENEEETDNVSSDVNNKIGIEKEEDVQDNEDMEE